MDRLRCMEVFVEVARHGSFAVAAERLNMSRASATKHVASLEHSLKAPLFDRATRKVTLTDAGSEVLEQAETYSYLLRCSGEQRANGTELRRGPPQG